MESLTVPAISQDIMDNARISSEVLNGITNSVGTITNLGGVAETIMNTKDLFGGYLL